MKAVIKMMAASEQNEFIEDRAPTLRIAPMGASLTGMHVYVALLQRANHSDMPAETRRADSGPVLRAKDSIQWGIEGICNI